MHKREIIHRDIKLENIILSHVSIVLPREWLKFVTLDGQFIAPNSLDLLFAELLYICHLRSLWECNTIRK